jgi:acyl-[acyl carrier protein]--UDP-N-acetylglucosamine O-acyltransferase
LQLSGTKAARSIIETQVGHDVWVGANAVIIGGITVGNGALIAAGAVVTHDVEPYAIVIGVPGRTVRYRFPEPIRTELLALNWWDLDREAVECLPHADIEKCLRILRLLRSAPAESAMSKRAPL